MKIYMVYSGEFDCDKPREYMSRPNILLVTTNLKEARRAIAAIEERAIEGGEEFK
jgi:hypothetical protein